MAMVGHPSGYTAEAELLSLDEDNHPVPGCLRGTVRDFPVATEGAMGGTSVGKK